MAARKNRTTSTKSATPAAAAAPALKIAPDSIPAPIPATKSALPREATAADLKITREAIAARAFEIHASGQGAGELDNWLQAERELAGR